MDMYAFFKTLILGVNVSIKTAYNSSIQKVTKIYCGSVLVLVILYFIFSFGLCSYHHLQPNANTP